MGLRLFANPEFDEAAAKRWDAKRFYEDESYYNDKIGAPVSCRHVLRLLPCGTQPDHSTQGPGKPALERTELQSRRPVFLGGSHLLLEHGTAR